MTPTSRRLALAITAALTLTLLIVFLAKPSIARDAIRPREADALAHWIADHPADWLGASIMADRALDSNTEQRNELRLASYEHALRLAPRRPNATAAFIRGGLFHWYELGEADRNEVLRVTAPMLGDPVFFARMHQPLWNLTRDLAWLRAHAPHTEEAIIALRDLAATHGFFADYRELRSALARKRFQTFQAGKGKLTAVELILLMPIPITRDDETLVRGVLEALHHQPLEASDAARVHERGADLAEFAIRNGITPLDGLEVLIETREVPAEKRARLARALGREDIARSIGAREAVQSGQWLGTCGVNEICSVATTTMTAVKEITVDLAVVQTDEVPAYVEVYVDDERVAEGPVEDTRRFNVPVKTAGAHRVELRLANPHTRNRIQRRLRLS